MFETDPHLWLQAFSWPWLLALMTAVSALGTLAFYIVAFVVLAFGVRLRPMLCVLLALILANTATGAIKLGFGLPRPSEVDARVLDVGEAGKALVERGGAEAFWALPDPAAVAVVRESGRRDYGFVSGHASAATAFALGLALFFGARRRWLWAVAIGWALLMGVSRLYLGRHFLGDVLGGWLVGGLAVWLAWWLARGFESGDPGVRRRAVTGCALGVGLLFLASLRLPFLEPGAVGELAGTLACVAVVARWGLIDDAAALRRAARVAVALLVIQGVNALSARVAEAGGWREADPMGFALAAAGFALAILGAAAVARWLGLYRGPAATAGDGAARLSGG